MTKQYIVHDIYENPTAYVSEPAHNQIRIINASTGNTIYMNLKELTQVLINIVTDDARGTAERIAKENDGSADQEQ